MITAVWPIIPAMPVWPLLRIDYILVPRNVECVEHTIHRTPFSDHYPVTAEIIL